MGSTETAAKLLDLEEGLTDSPGFRNRVGIFEEYATSLETAVQGLSKASRGFQQVSSEYSSRSTELLQRISSISKLSPMQDSAIDQALSGFSEVAQEIERNRILQCEQFQNILVGPLEALMGEDGPVQQLKTRRRRLDMQQADYESQLARGMARKDAEAESDVEAAKSRYLNTLQRQAIDLNRLAAVRRIEFVESFLSLMYAQYAFYHQAFSAIKDFEPAMRRLGEHLAKTRRAAELEIDESQALVIKPKQTTDRGSDESGYVRVGQQDDDMFGSVRSVEALGEPATEPPREPPRRRGRKSVASISLNAAGVFQMSGYLFLRSQYSLMASWQRRWFAIKDGQLEHVQRMDGRDLESIPLHLCQVKPAALQDRRNVFELIAPTRTYLLQAESDSELSAWTACLRQAIEASLYAHTPQGSAAPSQAPSKTNTPTPLQPAQFAVSRASSAQRADSDGEAARMRMAALRAVPGNNACVDCGRRAPEWAAINLGVLMCIECSGVHRSLGVHVSKVRSVKLDHWENELMHVMLRLGNRAVNAIYEAEDRQPGDPDKPSDRTPRDQATPFLSAKYASRVWVCRAESPDAQLFAAVQKEDLPGALLALAQGADANMHDGESGNTPLIAAASNGDFGMLELLMLWGASVSARAHVSASAYAAESAGGTALHAAVCAGNARVVWYLVRKGAQWDTPDAHGLLPLDIALERSDVQAVMALRYAAFQKAAGLPPGSAQAGELPDLDDSLIGSWAIPPYSPKRMSAEFTDFADSSMAADAAFDEPS